MTVLEIIMVLLVLLDVLLLGLSRLNASIRMVALQGFLLGLFSILVQWQQLTVRVLIISLTSVILKSFVYPFLLRRAIRESDLRREMRPLVGYNLSLACGLGMLAIAMWLNANLSFGGIHGVSLVVPVSFMTIFTGLFIIITRRTALAQCLGYVILENGIYTFGIAAVGEIPLLLELGILLDAFVAVFVMGIAIYHINREFEHIDVAELSTLKG
jgi:hydrogenase-4 component E